MFLAAFTSRSWRLPHGQVHSRTLNGSLSPTAPHSEHIRVDGNQRSTLANVRFTGRHLTRLEEIMRHVCADFETKLVKINGEPNHTHPLVNFPPKVALSKLVNSLKGVSSRRIRQEFPELARHYHRANKLWSGSYFAGSVSGAPLTVLHQYIEQQNHPA